MITLEQLPEKLKKIAAMYWLAGDEIFLRQEAQQKIRVAATQAGFLERKVYTIDTHFDWQIFLNDIQQFSLFSQHSLIELDLSEVKLNDEGKDVLIRYAAEPPTNKILMISSGKLDAKAQNTNWFKQITKQAIVVNIWPIDVKRMPQWIAQRLQESGLRVEKSGIQLLCDKMEGNLLSAQQAIDKLRLQYGNNNEVISVQDIAAVIVDSARYDIFDLIDSSLAGNKQRTLRIIKGLQTEGVEAPIILWAIARELRSLIAMAQQLAEGKTVEHIFFQFKVWEKRKSYIRAALQRLPLPFLYSLLQQAANIDRIIKGAMIGHVWNELMRLSLTICDKEFTLSTV
jgi:DNA polymerase-3 subunit delta